MEELYAGIKAACDVYQVDLVGGDTTSSRAGLIINVAVYGVVDKDKVVYRSGAKYQDLIVVSGDLGAAYLGLQVLEREKAVYSEHPDVQPDLDGYDYILMRQLKPEARKDIIEKLALQDVAPSSMIDISDGLASELIHLSKASGCGMRIYANKIPIDEAAALVAEEFSLDPITCALNGGEDYELLMTVPMPLIDRVNAIPSLKIIGHVTAEGGAVEMVVNDDQVIELKAQGWRHF
jgi:thiamine-monophosphate kinase